MNKKHSVMVLLVAIILAGTGGYFIGNMIGRKQMENRLSSVLDKAIVKPPEEIRMFYGTVKGIYGATIDIVILDPEDYLARYEGREQKTELRYATVTSETEILLIDRTSRDKFGNPTVSNLLLFDLKAGDEITVFSDQNIRKLRKFDVTRVEKIIN